MISFLIFGHPNVRCVHKSTLEFTKDKELGESGDCILGVGADFDANIIKDEIQGCSKGICTIVADDVQEKISFDINPDFFDENEVVLRIGSFDSSRTLGLRADKAARDIDRSIVDYLKQPENTAKVVMEFR